MRRTLLSIALVTATASLAGAQTPTVAKVEAGTPADRAKTGVLRDPVKVDSEHYSVEFEDATVRILRVKFAPGAGSVMHEHPRTVCLVALTPEHTRHMMPDSTTTETTHPAGAVDCSATATGWYRHQPTNISDQAAEYLIIERKPQGRARGIAPVPAKKKTP